MVIDELLMWLLALIILIIFIFWHHWLLASGFLYWLRRMMQRNLHSSCFYLPIFRSICCLFILVSVLFELLPSLWQFQHFIGFIQTPSQLTVTFVPSMTFYRFIVQVLQALAYCIAPLFSYNHFPTFCSGVNFLTSPQYSFKLV